MKHEVTKELRRTLVLPLVIASTRGCTMQEPTVGCSLHRDVRLQPHTGSHVMVRGDDEPAVGDYGF